MMGRATESRVMCIRCSNATRVRHVEASQYLVLFAGSTSVCHVATTRVADKAGGVNSQ